MRRLLILVILSALVVDAQIKDLSTDHPMMVIEMKPGDTHLDAAVRSGEGIFGRWLTLDTASFSTRYRHIDNFLGATTASNQQLMVVRSRQVIEPAENARPGQVADVSVRDADFIEEGLFRPSDEHPAANQIAVIIV